MEAHRIFSQRRRPDARQQDLPLPHLARIRTVQEGRPQRHLPVQHPIRTHIYCKNKVTQFLDHLSHYLFDSWVEKNYLRNDKYKEMEARMKKSYTIVKWYFGIIFYTFTSSFAYYLLKDSYFLPPFLGGNGSVFTMVENRYLEHTTEAMRIFYLIEMGKHLARFFMHVFIRSEGSYYEYVLHHSLATFLIFFSYTMNMWMVGIFVLFVHDLSDVTLALARGYREYKDRNSNILTFFYVIATGSWILLRVGIFTYCCIYGTWVEYLKAC